MQTKFKATENGLEEALKAPTAWPLEPVKNRAEILKLSQFVKR
jgi:hypothetical protein